MLNPSEFQKFGDLIGYGELIQRYHLKVLSPSRISIVSRKGGRKTLTHEGVEVHLYPHSYRPAKSDLKTHLEFALKHEGIELPILAALFVQIPQHEWKALVQETPTGIYTRKIWYLYEWHAGKKLALPDARGGTTVPLLDPEAYYTAVPLPSPRHRVRDNLLGNSQFCPMVRRTKTLATFEDKRLEKKIRTLLSQYPESTLKRAANYLFAKETRSSYEIEREKPNTDREARFINLLKRADGRLKLDIQKLIELQNVIVDPRFADKDLRTFQNYIGEEIGPDQQKIHYIPPKPQQVPALVQGLLSSLQRMLESRVHPVVIAGAISFGFVYIHPFEDGNGRLHRFLIHHVLAKTDFSPPGSLFPVSAVMLRNPGAYDTVLEVVSEPLMKLITGYTLSARGELTVKEDTSLYYPYLNYAPMAEFLFGCVQATMDEDFRQELDYLERYDKLRVAISEIVGLPNQKLDLLIQCLFQNGGKLAKRKQERHFSMLTANEVEAIEKSAHEIIT